MNGWQDDKAWSDRFIRDIKGLLGIALIGEASVEEDQLHNTDLIVLTVRPFRIGCRVRRPKDQFGNSTFEAYGDEFTIRMSRASGAETELSKILKGWGDYFFYGISNDKEDAFRCWGLGNLKVFRQWYSDEKGIPRRNRDGSSSFKTFKWSRLPPEFTVASRGIPRLGPHGFLVS